MASLGRASAILGAGTLVSRITGLIRTVFLVAALGNTGSAAADAFGIANQLPNNIYALISSGLFTGIVVPQIIKAARHTDGGNAFVSKFLTLGTVVLGVTTIVAVALTPAIVWLYGAEMPPDALALAIAFAYWCLPQLFFMGLFTLVGEVLNARKVFGPFAWAPIINNIISIVGFSAFILLFGQVTEAPVWTPGMIAVMGGTATFGIVAQALVLFLFWRRTGLKVRPDFRWRGMGLRGIGRLAGWSFLMVVVGQIAGLIQVRLVASVSGSDAAVASMQYAWLVVMLPFSVIVFSIGTPYFTRLAEHVAEGRADDVKSDIDQSTRIIGFFMVGSIAAVIAAILPISRVFTTSVDDAVYFSFVLGAFLVSLLPLSLQFTIQRTFYAYQDTRSPFFFTLLQAILVIVTAWLAWATVPPILLAAAMALGQSLANVIQLIVAIIMLRRKIGPTGIGRSTWSLVRFVLAALPAAVLGVLVYVQTAGWALGTTVSAVFSTVIVGAMTLIFYVALLALFRAPEVAVGMSLVRRITDRFQRPR